MIKPLWLLAIAALTFFTPTAQAQHAPPLQFSGFATLGLVATTHSDIRFARIGVDRPGAETPDFGPDTVLGIQGNYRLSDRTSAVIQLVSRERPTGSYAPHASLGFISYAPTSELNIRMGRLRVPFFMHSDSLDINYALPWIRPPVEVYGLNPFSDLDGIDLLYRVRLGTTDLELHPYAGRSAIPVYKGGHSRLDRLFGVNLSIVTDNLTVFLGHAEAALTLRWGDANFRQLTSILPPDLTRELSGGNGRASFSSAGFQWDDGNWQLTGEYARRINRRYANSAFGWHLTLAHRLADITPYLTLARQAEIRPVARYTFEQTPITALQEYAFGHFLRSRNLAQRSVTVGVRWDLERNIALKTEFTHTTTSKDSWGSFFPRGDVIANAPLDRSINMLGLSIDVTF